MSSGERPTFEWRIGRKYARPVFGGEEQMVRYDFKYEDLGTDERAARVYFENQRAEFIVHGGRIWTGNDVEMLDLWLEARPIPGEWTVIESSVEES